MKAKMCKVLSLTLAMVLAFTLIPARELAASTNEDTSTDTVQTEEEAPADTSKDDKAEKPSDDKKEEPAEKAPEEKKDDPETETLADNNDEKTDEVVETNSAEVKDDKQDNTSTKSRGAGDSKGSTGFIKQPKSGTVKIDDGINIEWETTFNPELIEIGFWINGVFTVIKTFEKEDFYTIFTSVIPKNPTVNLQYDDVINSTNYVVRAYYDSSKMNFEDSDRFTLSRESLKFTSSPANTLIPLKDLNFFSWSTNFNPELIKIGYWSGNVFNVVKEINELDYLAGKIPKSTQTYLKYDDDFEDSPYYIVRAYYSVKKDQYLDSSRFTIQREALVFETQPQGGIAAPNDIVSVSWETNFKPKYVQIGFYYNGKFNIVAVRERLDYLGGEIPLSASITIPYKDIITSNQYIARAYYNDKLFVDSKEFALYRGAVAFKKQPVGGTVSPRYGIEIKWGTYFKPEIVEIGYLSGDSFHVVKTLSTGNGHDPMVDDLTYLYYEDLIASSNYIVRAYADSNKEDYADSRTFTIEKEPIKFEGINAPREVYPNKDPQYIGWETNFYPERIEIGYWDGNQRNIAYELNAENSYDPSLRKNSVLAIWGRTVTSSEWYIRAYYDYANDIYVDSARFSLNQVPLNIYYIPNDVTVKPGETAELSFATNFYMDNEIMADAVLGYFDENGGQHDIASINNLFMQWGQFKIDYSDSRLVSSSKYYIRAYYRTSYIWSDYFSIRKVDTSGKCGDNLNWSYENGVLTICGTGAMYNYDDSFIGSAPWHWLSDEITSVNIGSNVTTIGNFAFKDCKSLKTIVIPESIRQIGEYSFYKAGLQSVTISSNIMLIPTGAFADNDLRNVTIPSGIVQINSNAFASNPNLWKVTFPSSLGSIGDCAFANCRINEIVLPEGLTSIGEGAFSNNKTVWGIKFPDSVTNIGARAFADCSALQKLEFEGGAPTIGSNAFSNDTAKAYYVIGLNGWDSSTLKNYGGTITWVGLQKCGENLTWTLDSEGVLTITGSGAMQSNFGDGNRPGWYNRRSEIKTIYIMPGVESIGGHAFANCSNVNTIVFYGSAPKPGVQMFQGITANAYYTPDESWTDSKLVSYGGNITWIPSNGQCGDNLFWRIDENKILHITGTGDMYDYPGNFSLPWYKWADDIVGVEIASGCTSIGEGAFYSCSKIESVTMSSTVKTIGKNAFYRCSRLSSINLSSALTTIGESAFYYCYALSEITIPDKVTVIDETAFMGCSSLISVVIPDSVVTLGLRAFAQCSSLEYVEIGKGVTVIPGSAFSSCKNLASVEFSGDVTAIYSYAFMGCSSLDYIELPAALKELGMSAFSNCESLSRIKIHDKLESLDYGVFSGCSALSEAFFYGTPEQWDAVTKGSSNTALINIVRCVRAEGDCSKNDSTEYSDVMWRLFWDGELRIFGFGKMNSYENPNFASDSSLIAPWNGFKDDITCVIIEEGVTNVGSFAFYNFTNLKSAILPEGMNSIENFAFAFCGFTTLKLPDTITEIQGHAFVNCSNLESIVIPDGVQEISEGTFFRCKALTTVTIPESVTKIGKEAFRECVALTEITIPSNVTIINNYAFDSCTGLEKVELNEGLKTINDSAFSNCSSLKEIVIPSTVTYIGNKGFSKCTSLKTVIFTGNAPLISTNRAFENVSTYAYYPATDSTWTESVRQDYGGTIKWVPLGEGELIVKFSHSCVLNNNLGINYYIPKDEVDGFDEFRLVIKKQVFDGAGSSFSCTETTLSNYSEATVDGVDYLCFGYYGIAAKEMGSELRATLYMKRDGVQYSTTVDIYSVAEYAYNRLNKSSDDRLKTLLVDMLDYGAASQTYLKYNTSNLVNAKLTSAQRAYGSEMPQPVSNELLISVEGNTAHFYGKSLILGNNVEIKYYMTFDNGKPADSVKLVLSYTSIDGKEYTKVVKASDFVYESKYKAYSASIDSIGAKDMSCVVTAKIYDGDTLIGDVCKYSIETYVYNRLQKSTDENLKAAVIAMYRYGKSAEQYFLNK